MKRRLLSVNGAEEIGPYTLLRVDRGGLETGVPGQFFMLEAPGRLLPRPMSLCLAAAHELAFLIDPIGPGTRALCTLEPGEELHVFGPLGNGFDLDVARPLLVGGGIGVAPFPFLSEALGAPPAILGFRLLATGGTASVLAAAGLDVGTLEKGDAVVDAIRAGRCDLVINTPQGSGARRDGALIRQTALAARVPCITTLSGARLAVDAIANAREEIARSLQERIEHETRAA